jgi:small subunit ribosomal protein S6
VERVQKFIQERGGEVKEVNPWGRRKLAYPIKQFVEGHYIVAQFSLDPQAVRALEGNLELAEDVIRHLVVKLEDRKGGPRRE